MADKFGWDNNFGNSSSKKQIGTQVTNDSPQRYQIEVKDEHGWCDYSDFGDKEEGLKAAKALAESFSEIKYIDKQNMLVLWEKIS